MEWEFLTVKSIEQIDVSIKQSNVKLIRIGFIVLSAVLLLTWLYLKSESVSSVAHIHYSDQLRKIREANTNVDSEMLSGRMELSRNYDALTNYLNELIATSHFVHDNPPSFLQTHNLDALNIKTHVLKETLKKKSHFIDLFKRNNAILRNSLVFFQKVANEAFTKTLEKDITRNLEQYVRQVLFFVRTPDLENKEKMLEIRNKLVISSEPVRLNEIKDILLHGDVISRYQPTVDELIRTTLLLPTIYQYEEIINAYQEGLENARELAKLYRNILYLVAVLLTGYLAYIFINLDRTRRSLAKAHKQVIEHYQAKMRAEKLLHLHDTAFNSTHEAITITDSEGTVVEVNPAFTRITGYERNEVLGKNPRVLKSGRHDIEFYREMWKSIEEKGNWRGEIWNRNKFGEIYPEILSITAVRNEDKKISNYVAVFSDISQIKEQENKLQKMAHYDALTSLPNRVLLIDRINQAQAQTKRNSNSILAVCFMDLDGFKPINDTHGHKAGDDLLIEISNRFINNLRGGDTVARLGGDEFVFLLLGLTSIEECENSLKRLMNIVRQPILINGEQVNISSSIGITLYPEDDTDADSLLRHSDQAMYRAKQKGKNCYTIFDPNKDTLERSKNERIGRIAKALNNDELVMYYQPKVNMCTGSIVGMEALIRWIHPERGIVPPIEFLPIIEESELSLFLGNWVIKTVLKQMTQWKEKGLELKVSINVTSRQIQDTGFLKTLKSLLDAHPKINPSNVELEILETAALEDIVNISQIIHECEKLGVSFALDDFGTGYSSLTYLKRLPAKTLKIDLSFVRDMLIDPENLAIVHAIMGLATAFQRHVVAEGVESVEHGRMLIQLGCTIAQGFGISKPMQANEILTWSENWQYPDLWNNIGQLYWEDNDYPLLAAEVEHQRWISLIVYAVNNEKPIPHSHIEDFHHCNFGEWYDSLGEQRYGDNSLFKNINESHKKVHQIALKIDQHLQDGEINKSKESLIELLSSRDDVIGQLHQLAISVAQKDSRIQ